MNQTLNLLRAGALALCLGFVSAPANAVVVTVNSVQYDVTIAAGNLTMASATLQNQVWWGDSALATAFATAVGSQLGLPNPEHNGAGPFFAYDSAASIASYAVFAPNVAPAPTFVMISQEASGAFRYWGVANQVAGVPDSGATIAMLGTALAVFIALRRQFA